MFDSSESAPVHLTASAELRRYCHHVRRGLTVSEPLRTCIGCKEKTAQSNLVRVVCLAGTGNQPSRAMIDERRRLPGRGAWIHDDPGCLGVARKKGAFNRAFRTRVNASELVIKA